MGEIFFLIVVFFYILFLSLNTWQIWVRKKKVFEGLQAFLFFKKKFVLRKNYCVRKIYDYIKLKILGPTPTLAAFFYNSLNSAFLTWEKGG